MIYLDYNATTPIAPEVKKAILPFLEEKFGNPSCTYPLGKQAKEAIEQARSQVASLINAQPEEVIFTSGGTESNNTVFKGILWVLKEKGRHIITTQIEHPSVLNPALFMESLGFEVTLIPPNPAGVVEPERIKKAIKKDTTLISVMHANNETGTIQPIATISQIAKEHGIIMHTDAAQSLGKIEVDVNALGVDLLTIAGHKLYAPKGIGALYVRKGTPFLSFMHGAGQEMGKRAGTENVALIVGLGKACALLQEKIKYKEYLQVARLRDKFWQGLAAKLDVVRFGDVAHCLPNTLFVGFKGLTGEAVLKAIPEICASTGAACHSNKVTLSHVLAAMGVDPEVGQGAVRFSLGYPTTEEEIETALNLIVNRVSNLLSSI
ncbi:MAG: cysteine desulfurase [Candidatus Desulfofervidaceae bacterium]|nr:cysteine desulfurase [Candidatus Desulfofervidaceae bacterium]